MGKGTGRTAKMDPITKIDVKHSIIHARDEMDETFIIVSHDMDFVRDVCDRCMFIRGGKIIAEGPTAEAGRPIGAGSAEQIFDLRLRVGCDECSHTSSVILHS